MLRVDVSHIAFTRELLLHLTSLFADEQGTCLLYSGGDEETAKRSFLFLFPYDTITLVDGEVVRRHIKWEQPVKRKGDNPWKILKELIPSFESEESYPEWNGFFGYELGAYADDDKEITHYKAPTPDCYLQRCVFTLIVDHQSQQAEIIIANDERPFLPEEQRHWLGVLANREYWEKLSNSVPNDEELDFKESDLKLTKSLESKDSYFKKIEEIKKLIVDGEVYQVNLSHQMQFEGNLYPFQTFRAISKLNPAPFSAFLCHKDVTIISSSPERLLCKEGKLLETRPIKGTIARGATEEEDAQQRAKLLASEKDSAELLMITDLMRNDLGKVSEAGTVNTVQIGRCEKYANVYHLSSVIQSKVKPSMHPFDVLRQCFPGGSVTGCPKLRAMEVIAFVEQRPRGVYTGSIGYFTQNGNFDMNIAIRTLVMTKEMINVQLGGAIVADSDPEVEYQETLSKGATILKVLKVAS